MQQNLFVEEIKKHFLNILNVKNIEKQTIAVAVSGGSDSLSLVLALYFAFCNDYCDNKIIAILVNHNLRKEAKDEVEYTKKVLKSFGIKSIVKNWNESVKKNLENEARKARYNLLLEGCKECGANILCIGHHKNDQVETFFLNLSRGSGLDGLCSMPYLFNIDGINIIRPMLHLTKKDGQDFLKKLNIKWCEDKSNYDRKYKRNNIRFLLNQLEDGDLITERIFKTINILQEVRETIDLLMEKTMKEMVFFENEVIKINKRKFLSLTSYLQKSVLSKCIVKLSQREYKLRAYQIDNIIKSIKDGNFKRTITNCIISFNEKNKNNKKCNDFILIERIK